jgi:DNA repair protein RecO (recombination protein O)
LVGNEKGVMAFYHATQAVVVRKQIRGEADSLCTVFTKEFGKMYVWSAGERKIASKLRGGLTLFSVTSIEFVQGKSRNIVTDARITSPFSVLQNSLERLQRAYRICRITDHLIKGQEKDTRVWDLLVEVLEALNDPELTETRLLDYYFLWRLLDLQGYQPDDQSIPQPILNMLHYMKAHKAKETAQCIYDSAQLQELRRFSQEYTSHIVS